MKSQWRYVKDFTDRENFNSTHAVRHWRLQKRQLLRDSCKLFYNKFGIVIREKPNSNCIDRCNTSKTVWKISTFYRLQPAAFYATGDNEPPPFGASQPARPVESKDCAPLSETVRAANVKVGRCSRFIHLIVSWLWFN